MKNKLSKIHEFVNSLEKVELSGEQESQLFIADESMYGKGSNKISCANSINIVGTCKNIGDCTNTQNSSSCNNTGVCSGSNNSVSCTGGSTRGSAGVFSLFGFPGF